MCMDFNLQTSNFQYFSVIKYKLNIKRDTKFKKMCSAKILTYLISKSFSLF